ncbi:hypothetical protein [Foetidibacter luteolus]|uniref:hypothetical protein n=1 Tax=Foetidibacter luteolus TaxID=2608880 RepID=UPI00129BE979|nr:hypothetical protein [Foetidibacter luteolus]
MNEVINNFKKPAPKWFRKLKNSVSIASDTAIVLLISTGHSENSVAMLIARVVVSNAMKMLEGILVEDEA